MTFKERGLVVNSKIFKRVMDSAKEGVDIGIVAPQVPSRLDRMLKASHGLSPTEVGIKGL